MLTGPDPLLGSRELDLGTDLVSTLERTRVDVPAPVTEALLGGTPGALDCEIGDVLAAALALAVALATQPTWRPGLIVISTLLAGALAWGALCSGRAGVHLALFADRAEWLARASLLPQAVWALGLVPWAKGGG